MQRRDYYTLIRAIKRSAKQGSELVRDASDETIKATRDQHRRIVENIIEEIKEDNKAFDPDRFRSELSK